MTAMGAAAVGRWHGATPTDEPLARFLGDLVSDELARLRPGAAGRLPALPWSADLAIDEDGLGLDSMERLSVATALTEALHLHESGLEDLLLVRRSFGEWVDLAAQSLALFDARLTFRTSGSSGRPKPCLHRLVDLETEADHWAALLKGTRRILCAVPSHHIYGFIFSLLLPPRLAGVEVLDVRKRTLPALCADLTAGDVVVGHPAFWALLLRHVDRLAPGVVGITSTAPCRDDVANGLVDAGLSRLFQIYGSSETAGLGWRCSASEPYRLLPHWERVEAAAGDVADDHLGVPDEAPTAGVDAPSWVGWRTAGPSPDEAPKRHRLPDRVDWLDTARFRVLGRVDAAVQVGGINVFPDRVRAVLLSHPAVVDAAVRRMLPDEGDRLKAFVVLRDDVPLDAPSAAEALTAWVATRLTAPERPRTFRTGAALPRNEVGKLSDWPAIDPAPGPAELADGADARVGELQTAGR